MKKVISILLALAFVLSSSFGAFAMEEYKVQEFAPSYDTITQIEGESQFDEGWEVVGSISVPVIYDPIQNKNIADNTNKVIDIPTGAITTIILRNTSDPNYFGFRIDNFSPLTIQEFRLSWQITNVFGAVHSDVDDGTFLYPKRYREFMHYYPDWQKGGVVTEGVLAGGSMNPNVISFYRY